ncbi:MAG: SWIB/MDM2 domain-containing protein [Candidatus ainarchaeum sp.]|nr:SWIB/MDM2 domain-containing protein [Candidatus ainarchaeum sp.]
MGLFGIGKKAPAKKAPAKKAPAKKSAGPKKAFGGYCISFKGQTATLEEVFGKTDITPSEMTKKIWAYVKKNDLAGKK